MRPLDKLIRSVRERKAMPYIPPGARVLDIGCGHGHLLRALGPRVTDSVGIDPDAPVGDAAGRPTPTRAHRLIRGRFPYDLGPIGTFDVITMLAVFEHFSEDDRPRVVEACRDLLRPHGRVVLTVPSPIVDRIVHVLVALRLADGIDIDSHHGYRQNGRPASSAGSAWCATSRSSLD